MTQSAYDRFLVYLDPDRARAGERYLKLHNSLLKILEWKGSQTPQEDADEIIDRVCRKLEAEEQIEDIFKYCHAVLNYVFKESMKKPKLKLVRQDDEEQRLSQIAAPELETPAEEDAQMACLKKCLNTLSTEKRNLIVEYYEGDQRSKIENRRRLAARLEISAHALEVRASRIRENLKNCTRYCLDQ